MCHCSWCYCENLLKTVQQLDLVLFSLFEIEQTRCVVRSWVGKHVATLPFSGAFEMLSIIGKLMHPLWEPSLQFRSGQRLPADHRCWLLPECSNCDSGWAPNFWPLNRLDICHRLPQWFLRSFNLFRSGFHSFHSGFRWRQCKQLQAVAAGIAGDAGLGHMGNGCCWWLLTLRQAAATEWRPVSPVRLPRCTMTHHYAPWRTFVWIEGFWTLLLSDEYARVHPSLSQQLFTLQAHDTMLRCLVATPSAHLFQGFR